jgi:hypothetical protein
MVTVADNRHALVIFLCVFLIAAQVQHLAARTTAGTADAASADPHAGKLPWNTENVGKGVIM